MEKGTAASGRFSILVSALVLLVAGNAALAADGVPQSLLLEYLADNSTFTLIDARSPGEFAASHIAGAINVPHDHTDARVPRLPSDSGAPIVVYCQTGKRASQLKAELIERGYTNVRVLQPQQIFWFEGLAVFNCGTNASQDSPNDLTTVLTEGKLEEKQ